jgi:hypothetical protein
VTLAIDKFGQNSEIFGLVEKIHSARTLQRDAMGDAAKLSRWENNIAVSNDLAAGAFRAGTKGARAAFNRAMMPPLSPPARETGG